MLPFNYLLVIVQHVIFGSAYCGSMWLAAVKVFCEMAKLQHCDDDLAFFESILDKAKASFERKLWNGLCTYMNNCILIPNQLKGQ
jgi:uncharacterized protein (DUF608 family)